MEKKKISLIRSYKNGKERGASLVEYGLLVALIAVVGIPAVRALGTTIKVKFTEAKDSFPGGGQLQDCVDSVFDPCP